VTEVASENALGERYEFACNLARRVGREALRFWHGGSADGLGTQAKGLQDFVTEADKQAEHTIRSELRRKFPTDGFIGEETGGETGSAGYWVVDPIDGTANYLRGLRHWGVSIAHVSGGRTVLGIVHDTPTDRVYHARIGHGALCDDQPIQVSQTTDPHAAMGILGVSRRIPIDSYLKQLRALHHAGIEHRKIGSAAIGIVRVAEGVADFYYEAHLNSWDALAAVLIAKEAGAAVKVPPMDEFISKGGEVLCATSALSRQLQSLLAQEPEDIK
jgi:myo-inositol-1(or 4)-monophosphatase